ncbi:transporter (NhaC family) [Scopulibacillus darangshiensis]|uniref:Transporter (NhaC family) n=1 Tax=Scopulibacillus darangshiensis TaxID=442528 RepID=A0A4R2P9E2_9BACL|nr:Na+/H+ antiporter NhaC [Scopulibacillus darangshiensis]TCP30958.1 transporter (NhaC family) [Scopulibacillus darangshiensis]
MESSTTQKKSPTFGAALVLIILCMILFIFGIAIYEIKAEFVLISATLFATVFAYFHGYHWNDIQELMAKKFKTALPGALILLSVGMLVGTWIAAGTIPLLVNYGLELINPKYLYITAFVVTAIISLCTGTSWGSVGTIGVALMGIGATLDVSLPITAGAVIAGGYFGDKLSPLSDSTNMSSLSVSVDLFTHIRHLMYTSIPACIIACIVYFTVGLGLDANSDATIKDVNEVLNALHSIFHFNLLLLIPPVIILYGSIRGKSPVVVMFISSAAAMILALIFQGFSISDVAKAAVEGFNVSMIKTAGFHPKNLPGDIATLLNRGGIYSMLNGLLFVFCAFLFASALEISGVLQVIIRKLLNFLHSVFSLVAASLASGLVIISCTGSAYVTYFLMSSLFKDPYMSKGLHPANLSRSMEDSVTIIEGLLPWTVSGVYMATTVGVSCFDYAPWAIFNWLGIIFSLLYAATYKYMKFGIKKLEDKPTEIEKEMQELPQNEVAK